MYAVPVLGTFRVDLANIMLEGLDLSDASTGLALGSDGAFLLSVQGLRANVNAHFTYQRTSFPQACPLFKYWKCLPFLTYHQIGVMHPM